MVGPPGWGVGEGLKNLHRKKEQIVTKWYTGPWASTDLSNR